jgi:hypothetical protein
MKILILFACAGALLAQDPPSAVKPTPVPAPVKPAATAPAPVKPGANPSTATPSTATTPAAVAAKPKASKAESLKYNLNWPTGLSLGEAILSSSPSEALLNFAFQMDVSVAGFSISESVDSRSTPEYCSTLLYKRGTRGKRKIDERTEFDAAKMTAVRRTEGGGKTELSTSACAKDALTFLFFLRRELAAGRLPPQQKVYYGGAYNVSVKFVSTEKMRVGEESIEVEKIAATVKGPASEVTADLFFAKDATRTPVLVRVPLKAGEFKLELIR